MNLPDPHKLLADSASLINQNQRILNVVFPENCGFDPTILVPRQLTGTEQLSEDYSYELELSCIDATLPAKYLHGLPIGVTILLDNGATRAICGVITHVHKGQSNGGDLPILVTFTSALGLMQHWHDSRYFHAKTIPDILVLLLQELQDRHPGSQAAFRTENRLTKTYPARDLTGMYRESAYQVFMRLSKFRGIGFRFTHAIENGLPVHTLILFDDPYSFNEITQNNGEVRFHRTDATEDTDSLDHWESERSTQPASTTLNSWVYQTSHIDHSTELTWMELGDTAPAPRRLRPPDQPLRRRTRTG